MSIVNLIFFIHKLTLNAILNIYGWLHDTLAGVELILLVFGVVMIVFLFGYVVYYYLDD